MPAMLGRNGVIIIQIGPGDTDEEAQTPDGPASTPAGDNEFQQRRRTKPSAKESGRMSSSSEAESGPAVSTSNTSAAESGSSANTSENSGRSASASPHPAVMVLQEISRCINRNTRLVAEAAEVVQDTVENTVENTVSSTASIIIRPLGRILALGLGLWGGCYLSTAHYELIFFICQCVPILTFLVIIGMCLLFPILILHIFENF